MTLIKKFESKFTMTPNVILNDEKLSLKAKGLWTYLNSKPDGWSFSVNGIKSQSKDGKEAVTSGLKELEESRYLKRVANKENDGRFNGYIYHIFDFPYDETTDDEKPDNGEHGNLSNTISSNKEEVIINEDLFGQKVDKKRKTLFKNSGYFEISIFKTKLKDVEVLGVDVDYYYRAILNWSTSKDVKRTADGWIATARTWMEKDKDDGKIRMMKTVDQTEQAEAEAKEYLST